MTLDERPALTASATAKVRRRLLPFLIACYLAAYLDRVNVGFAALEMNADLGIGPEAFGFTAGIFFLGYCLFEVPSNVILERVGARIWIARIMITWGLISGAMAFVTDATSLAVARFFLGVAEAGFFPGIIFYLTRWFPQQDRARIISMFMAAVPLSIVIGAPISGWILDAFRDVAPLKSWQWLFVIEAAPAILLGFAALRILIDRPEDAKWLSARERRALSETLDAERAEVERRHAYTLRDALTDPRIIALGVVYFGIAGGLYGLTFWLPQIVKNFGAGNTATGLITAAPYLVSALAMVAWGARSDRTGERIWHIAIPCLTAGAALIIGTATAQPALAMLAITIAAVCIFAALPTFWTLPTAMLTGAAAAGGVALINSIGNIGGFVGPTVIGWIKGQGFSDAVAVSSLAIWLIVSGGLVVRLGAAVDDAPTSRSRFTKA
jgi:ACS family tartrate transporter-like MFS transporter